MIVISYNGRAPRKEDQFLDVPISLDALQLVLLNRGLFKGTVSNIERLIPRYTGSTAGSFVWRYP